MPEIDSPLWARVPRSAQTPERASKRRRNEFAAQTRADAPVQERTSHVGTGPHQSRDRGGGGGMGALVNHTAVVELYLCHLPLVLR